MRYQRNLRKANRRFLIVNTALGLMLIIIVLAFCYVSMYMK